MSLQTTIAPPLLPCPSGESVSEIPQTPPPSASASQTPEIPEQSTEEPVLDYPWSRSRSKIRAAAKAYSEETHADY
jgi:hypothetical protein